MQRYSFFMTLYANGVSPIEFVDHGLNPLVWYSMRGSCSRCEAGIHPAEQARLIPMMVAGEAAEEDNAALCYDEEELLGGIAVQASI
jgi:hypothetical protein